MRNYRIQLTVFLTIFIISAVSLAVNSETVRQSSAAQFLKGETDNISIDSKGTISLARAAEEIDLGDVLGNAWIINDVVSDSRGNIYISTSPNGRVIRYARGKAEIIYPAENKDDKKAQGESVEVFENTHIFALAIDNKDRLLAGISGTDCKLIRFEDGKPETILEPENSNYIHDITFDRAGNIYIATGPEGIVYRMGASGKTASVVYDSQDKNILTITVGPNNFIYAGSDTRGLVYKIHPFNQTARVLFDSKQDEITDILLDDDNNLYVTATSAKSVSSQVRAAGITAPSQAGRPDSDKTENGDGNGNDQEEKTGAELKTANTDESKSSGAAPAPQEIKRGSAPNAAGYIYKIDQKGFVTEVFSDMAVFFRMASQDDKILLATGNDAELFSIDPKTEKHQLVYKDKDSSQITAMEVVGGKLLAATANPAKLISLTGQYNAKGTYISDLIDAGQPARWGKLQIDAEIPDGAKIMLAARSGNVEDPNAPTFSKWSKPAEITKATQIECPVARFCQYKLTLKTNDTNKTPKITSVAVSHVVPNLPPKVVYVKTALSKEPQKEGVTVISFTGVDDNKDTLRYKVEFRKVGRNRWIELEDKYEKSAYEWDTKTVEDGRYEVRVTANDVLSNTVATAMTGSRLSDSFVVDNTAPVITEEKIDVKGSTATLKLRVSDEFTAIGNVSYTVNSSKEYYSTLPDDLIYDTTTEDFTIEINDLKPGEHVISVRISDDIKNTRYKSYVINVE